MIKFPSFSFQSNPPIQNLAPEKGQKSQSLQTAPSAMPDHQNDLSFWKDHLISSMPMPAHQTTMPDHQTDIWFWKAHLIVNMFMPDHQIFMKDLQNHFLFRLIWPDPNTVPDRVLYWLSCKTMRTTTAPRTAATTTTIRSRTTPTKLRKMIFQNLITLQCRSERMGTTSKK